MSDMTKWVPWLTLGLLAALVGSQMGLFSVGTAVTANPNQTTVIQSGNCGTNKFSNLYVSGESTVKTITGATTFPTIAVVGQTSGAFLYTDGENNLITSLQTVALNGANAVFGTQVGCGDGTKYYIIAGNDTAAATKLLTNDYYLTPSTEFTIDGPQATANIRMNPIGNVTITATNATGTWTATPLQMGAFAASSSYPNYSIRLTETLRGHYNSPHVAFGVSAGATLTKLGQFTTFRPAGTAVVQDAIPNRLSGTYTESYKVADDLAPSGQLEFPLEIATAGTYNANAANITMIAYDLGTYQDRGKVISAAENLANVNVGGEDSAVFTFDCN